MEEALIKRVMPHSVEAEQSVVGAMLMDKDAITTASEIISGNDFYQSAYGIIFDSSAGEAEGEGRPSRGRQPGIRQGAGDCRAYIGECKVLCADCSGQVYDAQADQVK